MTDLDQVGAYFINMTIQATLLIIYGVKQRVS